MTDMCTLHAHTRTPLPWLPFNHGEPGNHKTYGIVVLYTKSFCTSYFSFLFSLFFPLFLLLRCVRMILCSCNGLLSTFRLFPLKLFVRERMRVFFFLFFFRMRSRDFVKTPKLWAKIFCDTAKKMKIPTRNKNPLARTNLVASASLR